jgi:hypothetical protein
MEFRIDRSALTVTTFERMRDRIASWHSGSRDRFPNGLPRSNSSGDSSLDLAPDFNEFCGLLNARRVEFVIVGAHALAFHGAPRFTGDLDILVRPTESNAERLVHAIGSNS